MRFVDFRLCEGFRMPAHDDGATHSGAGVRKPPREETESAKIGAAGKNPLNDQSKAILDSEPENVR
jgi:hypothetical protein